MKQISLSVEDILAAGADEGEGCLEEYSKDNQESDEEGGADENKHKGDVGRVGGQLCPPGVPAILTNQET